MNVIRVYDNLYGYIKFPKEFGPILEDKFFLRLQNIKQMGMTYYIFPDALHTRYSHSLGVFFIVQKMVKAQEDNYSPKKCFKMEEDDKRLLSLSALLHDIGHLPLSHTVERSLQKYKQEKEEQVRKASDTDFMNNNEDSSKQKKRIQQDTKLHERLGEKVLLYTSIGEVLRKNFGVDVLEVAKRFQGFEPSVEVNPTESAKRFVGRNFLHSQMDADRIDYLLRDSTFTGVKSGAFDFDKLIDEIRYEISDRVYFGINQDGIRALEQFFMARFAAYSQIPFNRRVHAFDYMASDFYYRLLKEKERKPSKYQDVYDYYSIEDMLVNAPEKFLAFTDRHFFGLVDRICKNPTSDPIANKYAELLYDGKCLVEVFSNEMFCSEEQWRKRDSKMQEFVTIDDEGKYSINNENVEKLAQKAGVNIDDIIIPLQPISVKVFDENTKDSIYIFLKDGSKKKLQECSQTFLNCFKDKKLYIERIFTFDYKKREKLRTALKKW